MAATRGPQQIKGNASRFVAIDYVNQLGIAPNGSRITSTEKNVLMALAQWFNVELGVAWPSIRRVANRCSISERHCRRTISRLERKGVIARVYMVRSDRGSQTSNEYFFPALGVPRETEEKLKARSQLQKVPRARMSIGASHTRPRPAAKSAPAPWTEASGPRGLQRPPIESLIGDEIEFIHENPGRSPRGIAGSEGEASSPTKTIPDLAKEAIEDLGLARAAWESALQKTHTTHGAKEFRTFSFQDVRVSSVKVGSNSTVHIKLRSPNPEKTKLGIYRFETTLTRALRSFYGCELKLECLGED